MSPAIPVLAVALLAGGPADGVLEIRIGEKGPDGIESPVAARIHVTGPDGRPVGSAKGEPADLRQPFFHDHFVCDGKLSLRVPTGAYRFTVERGPEYRSSEGSVTVPAGSRGETSVLLERWIDLAGRGWWSGDLHVHRPLEDMPLLLLAEDLHLAPTITVWNQSNLWRDRSLPPDRFVAVGPTRAYQPLACEDERRGGALLYFNLEKPLELGGDGAEYPSPMTHVIEAQGQHSAWIDVEKPFWWDVPVWVSSGRVQSMGIANNHMLRSGMLDNEAWGRPRDLARFPSPRGNGLYSQEIYYRLLNCGFRIPPTAGSASGVLPNPVGHNRVYVHLDGPFRPEEWWRRMGEGRSFVTNGPVLLVEANGRLPGEVFRSPAGSTVTIEIDVRAAGNDPIDAIEVIRDGAAVEDLCRHAPAGPEVETGEREPPRELWGRSRPLLFARSGWFLVRAIARRPGTFRFASCAPFYVEIGEERSTIHRADVEYFMEWMDARIEALQASPELQDPSRNEAVLRPHREARKNFERLREKAR